MVRFYTFVPSRFDDANYAYAEPIEPINFGNANVCPQCGRYTSHLKWLSPRNIKLSKASFGDFVFGSFEYFLASERVVNLYNSSPLSGIVTYEPIRNIKVLNNKRKDIPPSYYLAIVDQGSALVDEGRSRIQRMGQETKVLCKYCYATDSPWFEIHGFELKEDSWDGKDIFIPKGLRNVCFTHNFVTFCTKNNFTNFKFVATGDYVI